MSYVNTHIQNLKPSPAVQAEPIMISNNDRDVQPDPLNTVNVCIAFKDIHRQAFMTYILSYLCCLRYLNEHLYSISRSLALVLLNPFDLLTKK